MHCRLPGSWTKTVQVSSLCCYKENIRLLLDRKYVYSTYFGYVIYQKHPRKRPSQKIVSKVTIKPIGFFIISKWSYFPKVGFQMKRYTEQDRLVHRKHCFIDCTGLDWTGLDTTRWGRDFRGWDKVWGGRGGRMQPSLRQHKQHADTVTGNIICRQHHHIAL